MQNATIDSQYLAKLGRHLAHELNNPISAISSAAYLIHDFSETAEEGKVDVESIKPFVESIREECQKLKVVVEEFTRFVTLEGLLTMPIELSSFVSNRIGELSKLELHIEYENLAGENASITADGAQLQFLISSLASFAKGAGADKIKVSIASIEQSPEQKIYQLRFLDNRPVQLTEEERKEIFDPFASKRVRGMGLSLPLVKKIVTLHGGAIEMLPAQGDFTTEIRVSLPTPVKETV